MSRHHLFEWSIPTELMAVGITLLVAATIGFGFWCLYMAVYGKRKQ